MGYFPFFIDIEGKKGLVVGGGRIAAHKVEKLLPFMPELTVIAPVILRELMDNPALICLKRDFADEDLEGKMFVITASDDVRLNAHVAELCRAKNILVNVVDDKEACGFLFPALVKEGNLAIGISTQGASPQVASDMRSRMAGMLPARMEEILDYLARLREYAREKIPQDEQRSRFLKEAACLCMEKNRPLTEDERAYLLEAAPKKGSVVLVGAGCGAFDLITLKGLNALHYAQVLVYDDLLDKRLLAHAAESCEKIYVGKRNGKHSMPQEEINRLLIEKARQGKRVVRLKGGDPFVFGRGGEEILALCKEGIEVQEIPGITSAVGLPAAAGIPLTHRGVSRSFHVITGHGKDGKEGIMKELEQLAGISGTLVILMGFQYLEEISRRLMKSGKKPETPVAVVSGDFDGKVQTVRGMLADIAQKAEAAKFASPAVIVVGNAAGLDLF